MIDCTSSKHKMLHLPILNQLLKFRVAVYYIYYFQFQGHCGYQSNSLGSLRVLANGTNTGTIRKTAGLVKLNTFIFS